MRILLFTGKGGVGKTSVAAATALASADAGHRTLVLSTDPAHSLADSFGVDLGDIPTPVTKRLQGLQLDAQARMEESWDDIQRWLVEVFNWAGVDAIEAEELAVVPGLDEVFALGDIKTFAESGTGTPWSWTAHRPPRPSACSACPTSCRGTWSGSSRWAAGSTG